MRIFNVMFGKGLGGIEQAFVDYSQTLAEQKHQVVAVIHPNASVTHLLSKLNVTVRRVGNIGQWDPFAVSKLHNLIFSIHQPDIIVTHGNRATRLMRRAAGGKIPVVAVSHNYSLKNVKNVSAVLAITEDMYDHVLKQGISKDRVFHLPNMVDIAGVNEQAVNFLERGGESKPLVIGTMGRMVKKKGFDVFIKALSILDRNGVDFRVVVGGNGPELDSLRSLTVKLGIAQKVEFKGWIQKKDEFFDDIDIFCLPSLHEPFGIILLEAFMYRKPIVSSASEGPSEIIEHEKDGLLTEVGSADALASGLRKIIDNPEVASQLVINGYNKVAKKYSMDKVGKDLSDILSNIVDRDRAQKRATMLKY